MNTAVTAATVQGAVSVFLELQFWMLILFSFVLPALIYTVLWRKQVISPLTVLAFGALLVLVAGVDVYLLQALADEARLTPSSADDAVFLSELSVALYVLPVVFGGMGVNLMSHVLLRHLSDAEKRMQERDSSR